MKYTNPLKLPIQRMVLLCISASEVAAELKRLEDFELLSLNFEIFLASLNCLL